MSAATVISNREATDLLETFGVIDFEEIVKFVADVGNHDTYRRPLRSMTIFGPSKLFRNPLTLGDRGSRRTSTDQREVIAARPS